MELTPPPSPGSEQMELRAGGEVRTTVHTPVQLGALQSVELTYHDHHGTEQRALSAVAVRVSTADDQLRVTSQRLCYSGPAIADKQTATFQACNE